MIENKYDHVVGNGYGGMGGSWIAILLVVIVLFVLFDRKDGHHDGGHGYDHGYGHGYGHYGYGYDGCGPCVQPTFKDESNYEEERNINAKLCKIDEDVWKTACETQKVEMCEATKTRELIEHNYIQDLRDKLVESQMCNMTLKQEMFTEKKIDQVLGAIGKTDRMIEKLDCECVKRPPVWADCQTPNTHEIDCRGDRRFGFRDFDRCGDCF